MTNAVPNLVWIAACLLAVASTARAGEPATVPAGGWVEVSFRLDVEGNPFDFEQHDVRLAVTTPAGERSLPAFYDGDRWRVRYRPAGDEAYTLGDITRNGEAVDVDRAIAVMQPAGRADYGFVRLDPTKRHFVFEDGTPYYPVGYNLAWRSRGEANMPPLVESLARMGGARVNWTRLWMNHWDAKNLDWIEGDLPGGQPPIGELSLFVARKWDGLIAAAEANGVCLQMVLQHHGQYSTAADPNWATNPWNAANGGFLASPIDFFTNERARALTKRKLRYIVARYGHSPAVLAWELFNEVQYTDAYRSGDPADREAIYAWHEEMATFLREHDPHGHLITTSSVVDDAGPWRATDYYQGHVYPPDLIAAIDALDGVGLDRSYFYGEIGSDAAGDDPNAAADTLHRLLWASVTSQSAGTAQYWYWDLVEQRDLLGQFTAIQRFLDLAGIRGRADLEPIDVVVDAGALGPLTFGPALGWAPSRATEFTALPSGRIEGGSGMSAYLQGDSNRAMFPHATFRVNFPKNGEFAVAFDGVAPGGAAVDISVDGEVRATATLAPPRDGDEAEPRPLALTLSVPLSAGEHEIRLENVGPDWIRIATFTLSPYAPPLAVRAKGDADLIVLWAYRRDTTAAATPIEHATLILPDVPAGRFNVDWVATATGTVVSRGESTSDGTLRLSPPAITHDLAAVVRRVTEE